MTETSCTHCGLFHPATRPCAHLALIPSLPARPLIPARPLAGRYALARPIHLGGMSVVYQAEDLYRNGPVVVKELRVPVDITAEDRQEAETWFLREATLLSTLRHPLIPRFHGAVEENGRRFLIQEQVPGESLERLVIDKGPIAEEQALAWGRTLCELLAYLHGLPAPIIFRDLKPANILVRPDGRLAVVDFGIARPYRPHQIGTVIGTPGYAPPEQYQGLASPFSDVYALGATLHRALSGYNPEHGPSFTFPPLRQLNPRVSERLEALIARTLSLKPTDRPSVGALAGEMHAIAQGQADGGLVPAVRALTNQGCVQRYALGVGMAAAPLAMEALFGALQMYEVVWATFLLLLLMEGIGFGVAIGSLFVDRARWVGMGALTVQAMLLYWFFSMPFYL